MCGAEPHATRVTAVQRAQRAHTYGLGHKAHGLTWERALDPGAPMFGVLAPGALGFPVATTLAPHTAPKHPHEGHVGTGGARKEGLMPCTALLQGLRRSGDRRCLAGSWRRGAQGF